MYHSWDLLFYIESSSEVLFQKLGVVLLIKAQALGYSSWRS